METLTETLIERVDKLVNPNRPLEWGNPLLSATPACIAIHELAVQTQALAYALREVALEVQRLSGPE